MDDVPANDWLSWRYVSRNWGELAEHLGTHASLTLQAVAIAFAIALPLALLAHRYSRTATRACLRRFCLQRPCCTRSPRLRFLLC